MNTYVPTMTLYDAQVFKVCFVMSSPRFPIPPSINPRLIGWGRQSSQQVSNTGTREAPSSHSDPAPLPPVSTALCTGLRGRHGTQTRRP